MNLNVYFINIKARIWARVSRKQKIYILVVLLAMFESKRNSRECLVP